MTTRTWSCLGCAGIAQAVLLVVIALMGCSRSQSGAAGSLPADFETHVAAIGNELVVLARRQEAGGSWLFRSGDNGMSWRRWDVDAEVEALAGRRDHWALLVRGWAVLESRDGGRTFSKLSLPAHDEPAYYGIRVEPDDTITVWGRNWIYRDGKLVGRLPDAVARAPFPLDQLIADVRDDDLVVVNPFMVYRLAPILAPFSEGLPPAPERWSGIVHLASVDRTWIAASYDGTYLRRPGDRAWRKISGGTVQEARERMARFAQNTARDLVASPFEPGAWIVADDDGLHAQTLGGVAKRLWEQPPDFRRGLVSNLAHTSDAVAAGFHRASRDAAGVIVRKDGTAALIELPER